MGSSTPPTEPEGRSIVASVRLEREQFLAFRDLASANYRTVSQELRRLVDQRLEERETPLEAAA